jgi:hypothetical protein
MSWVVVRNPQWRGWAAKGEDGLCRGEEEGVTVPAREELDLLIYLALIGFEGQGEFAVGGHHFPAGCARGLLKSGRLGRGRGVKEKREHERQEQTSSPRLNPGAQIVDSLFHHTPPGIPAK